MRRGEVWTAAHGPGYAGKPRPVVVIQDDHFTGTDSVTICAFTTDPVNAPLFRIPVAASESNGLRAASQLMVDKIVTVARQRLRKRIGRLEDEYLVRLNRAIAVFLGLAVSRRAPGPRGSAVISRRV